MGLGSLLQLCLQECERRYLQVSGTEKLKEWSSTSSEPRVRFLVLVRAGKRERENAKEGGRAKTRTI